MPALRAIQIVVWAAVAVLGGAVLWQIAFNKDQQAVVAASIGGPFELLDQSGAKVTEAALRGHPSALFFGYTNCTDACPTTLADMTIWLKDLGADADKLKVFFVTVDPERDTPERMAAYLESFDPRIVGLTGARSAIDKMLKEFRVYSRRVGDEDSYAMDHPASIYLFDEKAQFVSTVDYQERPESVMAKLKRLVGT